MLDADSVEWFKQNGGLTRENGQHFRDTLLSQGGSQDATKIFHDFTGRDPTLPRDAYVLRVAATVGRLGRQSHHPSTSNAAGAGPKEVLPAPAAVQ